MFHHRLLRYARPSGLPSSGRPEPKGKSKPENTIFKAVSPCRPFRTPFMEAWWPGPAIRLTAKKEIVKIDCSSSITTSSSPAQSFMSQAKYVLFKTYLCPYSTTAILGMLFLLAYPHREDHIQKTIPTFMGSSYGSLVASRGVTAPSQAQILASSSSSLTRN
uniref:Uncharacterized protein n=1 Tax=Gossypium raimondii TaxID=29730 RepID=A0A0D2N6Q2_GOSRA|nr:hypothetical protein B456_001G076100 [Gossypium raimondii]